MMKIHNIFTNEIEDLPSAKADFLLLIQNNKNTISSVDAEFLQTQTVSNHTPTEIPVSTILTRTVHNLQPFSNIEVLDFGEEKEGFNAREIFIKGIDFGKNYELRGNYLILSSDRSAKLAISKNLLSLLEYALQEQEEETKCFEKLSVMGNPMLLFCAGFLLEATRRFHVVLSGELEMAVVLLIADKLREEVLMQLKSQNLTLVTTVLKENTQPNNIKNLLLKLSYTPHVICTNVSFKDAEIEALQNFHLGESKDGICASAALAYAHANGIEIAQVLNEAELLIYMM